MIDVGDPQLVARFQSAANASTHSTYSLIPVFINCFNRVDGLRQLVDWLLRAGQRRIILLDNQSSYPPLLKYYEDLAGERRITVVRLNGNLGHVALWASGLLGQLEWSNPFVCTDPDIVPDNACPGDFLKYFEAILDKNPWAMKVGFGLRIDDIPDSIS